MTPLDKDHCEFRPLFAGLGLYKLSRGTSKESSRLKKIGRVPNSEKYQSEVSKCLNYIFMHP